MTGLQLLNTRSTPKTLNNLGYTNTDSSGITLAYSFLVTLTYVDSSLDTFIFDNHGTELHRTEAETVRIVARHFCWANLGDDVNRYIFQCTCQHHQPTPNNTVHHYLAPPIEIPEDHVTAHTLSYYDDSDSYGYHSGTD